MLQCHCPPMAATAKILPVPQTCVSLLHASLIHSFLVAALLVAELFGADLLVAEPLFAKNVPVAMFLDCAQVGDWGREGAFNQTLVADAMAAKAAAMGGIDFVISTGG